MKQRLRTKSAVIMAHTHDEEHQDEHMLEAAQDDTRRHFHFRSAAQRFRKATTVAQLAVPRCVPAEWQSSQ